MPVCCFRTGRRRLASAGFTLLELMLALALTAVVLVLMNMAIDLHLRSLTSRRMQLEESQLARSILRTVADDIRSVVQAYKQDLSSVEAMMQQAATAAVGQAASGLTPDSGAGPSDPNAPAQPGNGQGGQPGQGGTQSGGIPAGIPAGETGGVPGAGGAGGTFTNGSAGQTSSSSGMTSSTSGSGTEPSSSDMATTDLSTASVPELPGVYGNQYQLQLDVSRLPRIDQYQGDANAGDLSGVIDVPSDVKTVTYYVKTAPAVASAATARPTTVSDLTDPNANATGLVRRELDRAVTSSAMEMGNFTGLENSGELIAPEVAGIEFRYFDGVEWLTEWDTSTEQTLPIAIEILVSMVTTVDAPASASSKDEAVTANRIYRMVVQLPTGGQPSESASASTSSSTSSSSSTTSSGAGL